MEVISVKTWGIRRKSLCHLFFKVNCKLAFLWKYACNIVELFTYTWLWFTNHRIIKLKAWCAFNLVVSLKYTVSYFYLIQTKAIFNLYYSSWFCHENYWQPILKVLLQHLHYNFYKEWHNKSLLSDETRWTCIFKGFDIRANWLTDQFA